MKFLFISLSFFISIGCAKTSFEVAEKVEEVLPEKPSDTFSFQKQFALNPKREQFTQSSLELNQTQIRFEVVDRNNQNVTDYKVSDLLLSENSKSVTKFELESTTDSIGYKADIVFVIDVTNSMAEAITEAKNKVRDFARKLDASRINGRFCLVAFRDATVKKCLTIVEDDPTTSRNENLESFLVDLNALKTVPSGKSDENQLRGLIDAAVVTPWRANSQRIAILITNSGFAYAPDNTGDAGADAPTYKETLETLSDRALQVFAVAPKRAGYSRAFGSFPSLTTGTDGEFFEFSKVIGGNSSFDKVYDRVISRITTTYTLTFSPEENGLDAHLALEKRLFKLQSRKSNSDKIKVLGSSSKWPFGKPHNSKNFMMAELSLSSNVTVSVDGEVLTNGFKIKGAELQFDVPPRDGAEIQVVYIPKNYIPALQLSSISLPVNLVLSSLVVKANGVEVPLAKLKLSTTSSEILLNPKFFLDSGAEEYGIVSLGGLKLQISGALIQN